MTPPALFVSRALAGNELNSITPALPFWVWRFFKFRQKNLEIEINVKRRQSTDFFPRIVLFCITTHLQNKRWKYIKIIFYQSTQLVVISFTFFLFLRNHQTRQNILLLRVKLWCVSVKIYDFFREVLDWSFRLMRNRTRHHPFNKYAKFSEKLTFLFQKFLRTY